MKLGKVIKFYRTQSGFKQAELADLAGINDKYYGKIERDESSADRRKIASDSYGFEYQHVGVL